MRINFSIEMCNNWNFKINFDSRKPKRNSTPEFPWQHNNNWQHASYLQAKGFIQQVMQIIIIVIIYYTFQKGASLLTNLNQNYYFCLRKCCSSSSEQFRRDQRPMKSRNQDPKVTRWMQIRKRWRMTQCKACLEVNWTFWLDIRTSLVENQGRN